MVTNCPYILYYKVRFLQVFLRIYTDMANIFKIGKNSAETLPPRCFLVILVVLFSNLEICLGMLAYGANLGLSASIGIRTDNGKCSAIFIPPLVLFFILK